ncbi:MAG: SAM-dependent methyltransferase [Alphaproteobacteria bacterium]|jgi:SAM-dependent methyltransferase
MPNWDKRYAEADGPLFGGVPNNYVVQTVARLDFDARSALCLADGDGRNGRYLARQGLAVTGVDISAIGTAQAKALDDGAGVPVERITADLGNWQPDAEKRWGSAFLIYLHCEREVRQRAVELAASHLESGGWFVAEGFAADFGDGPRMGPGDPALLYDIAEFDRWLPGFELVEAIQGTIRLQEGSKHQGLAQVVRYAARKT